MRWSNKVLHWHPQHDAKQKGNRQRSRPRKRWQDDICAFLTAANVDGREQWLQTRIRLHVAECSRKRIRNWKLTYG